MRILALVVVAAACSACLHTSVDTDGQWSALDKPCVSVGEARKLLDTRFSLIFAPAGDTLLYSGGQTVEQLDLASGESTVVLRSDGISQFGSVGDNIVYYESDGDTSSRSPINLIVDHGAHSTSRYERVSPRPNRYQAGLVTTPNGAYWWTSYDGAPQTAEYWRWNPTTNTVEPFPLDATAFAKTDDDSFFYFDQLNKLVVQPQLGGPPELVVELDPTLPRPNAIGIDGDDLFYVNYRSEELDGNLVTRTRDGEERTLVTDNIVVGGAVDPTYVYFTVDCGVSDGGPFDSRCQNLYRVPRAGGPIETFFQGEENTAIFDVVVDRCNVYWQQFTTDGGALYAREITQ